MKKYLLLTIAALFQWANVSLYAQQADSLPSSAQKDSIAKQNDSLNSSILKNFNRKLSEIEQFRIADSINKAKLEKQIASLQSNDNVKKEELEKQLQALRDKEALRYEEKKKQVDSLRLTAKAYPVVGFFQDTLFNIYNKSGSFTAQDRADAVDQRVEELSHVFRFQRDSLKVVKGDITTDVVFHDRIILSVSDNDAIWENSTRDALAAEYKDIIASEVVKYQKETSFKTLAKEIGLALLLIIFFILIIKYIIKLFRWTRHKIIAQNGRLIKGVRIKNYTLFDASSEVNFFLNINNILKWVLVILAVYIALPVIFGIFPWTKNFAGILFGYILDPIRKIGIAFWDFIPKLITIIVILFVFRYVFKGLAFIKEEIKNEQLKIPGFYSDWANPTYQIVRVLLFAFMVVIIYPYLPGSSSPVFKGVSVFLGFLFTFGSAGSLSNLISGLILTYMRLFKIGDRVKIGEQVGDVIEKSLLVTRIRTIKNEIVSIPNSAVMSSHTINYSSDAPGLGLIINTTVTIGYDVPWKDMHAALIDAALRTEYVLQDPKPFVLQTGLQDFYVSYQINAYIRESNKQANIYSYLYQNIQDVCFERGIEIMSPHYFAARDGNATAIPPGYLPKDYKAAGFKVNTKNDNEQKNNE